VPDRFSSRKIWIDYDSGEQIKAKATIIKHIIPSDVKTILDIGCGNGVITNALAVDWDITGLDTSEEALRFLKCSSIMASATEIPLGNGSFDLALSSEMLEHLNRKDLTQALSEIKRIGAMYLLISVPNKEYLKASELKCPICGEVFHAWHHLQSFSGKIMQSLFEPEFQLVKRITFGPKQQRWIPILLNIRKSQRQWLYPGNKSICPSCGNTEFEQPIGNYLTRMVNGINRLFSGTRPYWQICLYVRKTAL
jgi:SAM-dependent methyltransferase